MLRINWESFLASKALPWVHAVVAVTNELVVHCQHQPCPRTLDRLLLLLLQIVSYTPLKLVHRDRIELPSLLCKSRALPLDERGKKNMERLTGFEPVTSCLASKYSTN